MRPRPDIDLMTEGEQACSKLRVSDHVYNLRNSPRTKKGLVKNSK